MQGNVNIEGRTPIERAWWRAISSVFAVALLLEIAGCYPADANTDSANCLENPTGEIGARNNVEHIISVNTRMFQVFELSFPDCDNIFSVTVEPELAANGDRMLRFFLLPDGIETCTVTVTPSGEIKMVVQPVVYKTDSGETILIVGWSVTEDQKNIVMTVGGQFRWEVTEQPSGKYLPANGGSL